MRRSKYTNSGSTHDDLTQDQYLNSVYSKN